MVRLDALWIAMIICLIASPLNSQQPLLELPFPTGKAYRCSQGPGVGTHNDKINATHNDFDFALETGKDVTAAAPGIAHLHYCCAKQCVGGTRSGNACSINSDCPGGACRGGSFGNHITIDHGDSLFTLYAHLESFSVVDGEHVGRGQKIATADSTGYSTGSHLHFGLHQGDPLRDASFSTSVFMDSIVIKDKTAGTQPEAVSGVASSFTCGERTVGHFYESVLSGLPIGFFDEITQSGIIRGWSYDPNHAESSNTIQIFIDGPGCTGRPECGTLIHSGPTNILRADVNSAFGITGAHGFEFAIPASYRDSQSHSVFIYGLDLDDPTKSTLLTGSPKMFTLLGSATDSAWTQRFPANSPAAKLGAAMAFDAARQEVVLFGGQDCCAYYNDTWVWDGINWTQKFPATSPPRRTLHGMAYDALHQQVVLFGGRRPNGTYLSDTWVWDGINWTQKFPATTPPVRHAPGDFGTLIWPLSEV